MGYDFENILQTQKFAMSEWNKCETSHIMEAQANQGGLNYSENNMSKPENCMYRAAYTVTALKKVIGMAMQHSSTKIPTI